MDIIEKALNFATKAHQGQLRKYTLEPYINHPIAVAEIVKSVAHTDEMVAAALLHDVVEDTEHNFADIFSAFGRIVSDYVYGLTDRSILSDGNREVRKEIDRSHLKFQIPETKTIKLADLIHNSNSIVQHDPDFAKIYMNEKMLLLGVLSEGDFTLLKKAYDIVAEYYRNR